MADESRKYGAQGGKKRAAKLSKEELSEIGRKGAAIRWADKEPKVPLAIYGAADKPVRIGDVELPCYVLGDGRRVLIQGGLLTALDLKRGSGGQKGVGDRLANFIATKALSPFVTPELAAMIASPIKFRVGSSIAHGYEATVLADICDLVLRARDAGELNYQQERIAKQCEILVRGFARVGIIALVDEATGYQEYRARDALAVILEKFVAKELRAWVRTFPPEYYAQIFRLRGWGEYVDGHGSPGVVAYWTNDIVYSRLAPKVLAELQRLTPRGESGRLKNRLFQWLTEDHGHPRLREHLAGVVMLMKYSPDWHEFMRRLNREFPKYGETLELPFPEDTVREANKTPLSLPAVTSSSPEELTAPA